MPQDPIYLDHNATTPILPEVLDAMMPYLERDFGNPSSGHVYGARARVAIARARGRVAQLLGCEEDEIVFTSGGTEANNLAIRGIAEAHALASPRETRHPRKHVVTTVIEHPATARPCDWLESNGYRVTRLGVDADGRTKAEESDQVVTDDTMLVTVMHSNNETGVIQPVAHIAGHAREHGAIVHSDAAQSVGKVEVDVGALGVDLLSIAGHKLYAPKGVGALYVRRGTPLSPLCLGGGHERGLRPGTENVAYIVGLGAACDVARRQIFERSQRMTALREELWERLRRAIPGLHRNGKNAPCLPNTLNVLFPRVTGGSVLAGAPEIAASTGSACHEGHERPSSVLLAMGVDPELALGSVRLSVGVTTTPEDVSRAADALSRSWEKLVS